MNEGDDDPKRVADPRVDLRSVVVTYGRSSVQVSERIDDLQTTGFQQFVVGLKGPGVTFFGYGVVNADMRWSLRWERSNGASGPVRVHCPGLSGRPDFASDVLLFSMSAHCLGSPHWVSILVSNTLYETNDAEYEDALDAEQIPSRGYSARVYRP